MTCSQIKRIACFLTVLFGSLWTALGQNAVARCSAADNVPPGIATISAALGICLQVGRAVTLRNSRELGLRSAQPNANQGTAEAEANTALIRSRASDALAELNQSILAVSDASKTKVKDIKHDLDKEHKVQIQLQIAAAIIGMLGGGVGGGLHLVSNPQVMHAATVVGISAGVAGGTLGIINAGRQSHQSTNLQANLTPDVTSYIIAWNESQAGPRKFDLNGVDEDPSSLLPLLYFMRVELQGLPGMSGGNP
jgi:hypothetical protein